jgi:ribosomal protein S2
MIVHEAKKINLPIVGMVNSHCSIEVDYPIFAQDQTIQSVHFFCYFFATLIVKENLYLQHKRYTLQKAVTKSSIRSTNFLSKRESKFQNIVYKTNKSKF